MPRSLHFTRFLLVSLTLHGLIVSAAIFLVNHRDAVLPVITPVNIVRLPQEIIEKLPPLPPRPAPAPERIIPPERVVPPKSVPAPEKFGTAPEVALPRAAPGPGHPEGSEEGTADKGGEGPAAQPKGPLPFLSQADIDALARKGMPERKPGDDSVTLDTDEFKFISYNRWLKIKVESVLHYPELAAISGIQGMLYLKFDIMKDGSLGGLELLKSSGYKILDDEALRAIRASTPFQPLPDEWRMERYSIRAAVLFYLSGAYVR
jgi:protein TonB